MLRNVYLGLPRIGAVEPESCLSAVQWASMGTLGLTVSIEYMMGSLLAFNCNRLFCNFLKGGYNYFALLHSDIKCSDGWLDTMIAELGDADIIHAVCAIKDNRGLTSTAIGSVEERFSQVRKLTVGEVLQLPHRFLLEDVQKLPGRRPGGTECLLPNTGCIVMKRGAWCDKFPGFSITDQIVAGQAQCEPEDWAFGRWAAKNGLKVVGTRSVRTEHYGRYAFTVDQPWGTMQVDAGWL